MNTLILIRFDLRTITVILKAHLPVGTTHADLISNFIHVRGQCLLTELFFCFPSLGLLTWTCRTPQVFAEAADELVRAKGEGGWGGGWGEGRERENRGGDGVYDAVTWFELWLIYSLTWCPVNLPLTAKYACFSSATYYVSVKCLNFGAVGVAEGGVWCLWEMRMFVGDVLTVYVAPPSLSPRLPSNSSYPFRNPHPYHLIKINFVHLRDATKVVGCCLWIKFQWDWIIIRIVIGGHTTEMLPLVDALGTHYKYRTYIIAETDALSEKKANFLVFSIIFQFWFGKYSWRKIAKSFTKILFIDLPLEGVVSRTLLNKGGC